MRRQAHRAARGLWAGIVLVFAGLALLAYLGGPGTGSEADPMPVTEPGAGEPVSPRLSSRPAGSGDAVQPGRVAIEVEEAASKAGTEEQDERKAVLTGRCVAAEDGRPLADCEIFLCGLSLDGGGIGDWEGSPASTEIMPWETGSGWSAILSEDRDRLWIRPIHLDRFFLTQKALVDLRKKGELYQRKPNATTDAEGRFRLEYSPGGEDDQIWWRVFTSSPMRLSRESRDFDLAPGETRDVGVLRLHAGVRVRGHLSNTSGERLVGASLRIHGLPRHLLEQTSDTWYHPVHTTTKKDGWFAFSQPIPDGAWRITVEAPGIASFSRWIIVAGQALDLDLQVQERPRITGIVRDTKGKPVAGIGLLAVSADRKRQGYGKSDAQGRFVIRATSESMPAVRLVTEYLAQELIDAPRAVAWGSRDVQLVSRPSPPLTLLMKDQATGEPVTGTFNIDARPDWAESGEGVAHLDTPFEGKLEIEHIRSGPHRLWINLNGDNHWMVHVVQVDIPHDTPRRLEVRLRRSVPFDVLVVDAQDQPIANAHLGASKAGEPGDEVPSWYNSPDFLAHGRSNAQGIATLVGVAADVPFDLQVHHDQYPTALERGLRIHPNRRQIRVVLHRGGRLSGCVIPAGNQGVRWTLRLVETSRKTEVQIGIGDDGSYQLASIPAGDYEVHLQSTTGQCKRVAAVMIRPGGHHDLDIHHALEAPAELWLRVQGLPTTVGSWTPYLFSDIWQPALDRDHGERMGPGGTLHQVLASGSYELLLLPNSAKVAQTPYYHSKQPLVLKPGDKLRTPIQVHPLQTRLTVLDAAGKPTALQSFELQYRHPHDKSWTSHGSLRTDAKGSHLLQQLTPWPLRLLIPGTQRSTKPQTWKGEKTLRLQLEPR